MSVRSCLWLPTLMAATLKRCVNDIRCQLVQVRCLICLAVRRSVVILAREIHLGGQGLRRTRSQFVSRRTCVHTMAVDWVALLGLVRAKVVLNGVRPLPLIVTMLLVNGKICEALANASFITIHHLLDRCVAVLILATTILAHRTIIYWL